MTYKTFNSLWNEVSDYTNMEMFVHERGWQPWMDEYGEGAAAGAQILDDLENIWEVATMSWSELLQAAQMSQSECSLRYNIPRNTVGQWSRGERTPPDYIKLLVAESQGLIKVKRK